MVVQDVFAGERGLDRRQRAMNISLVLRVINVKWYYNCLRRKNTKVLVEEWNSGAVSVCQHRDGRTCAARFCLIQNQESWGR